MQVRVRQVTIVIAGISRLATLSLLTIPLPLSVAPIPLSRSLSVLSCLAMFPVFPVIKNRVQCLVDEAFGVVKKVPMERLFSPELKQLTRSLMSA